VVVISELTCSGKQYSVFGECESLTISVTRSVSPTSPAVAFISLLVSLCVAPALPSELGFLPSPLMLFIPNAKASNIGLDPNEANGDGSGLELCIEIDLERGVWFSAQPFDCGTPTMSNLARMEW
jgi:hypothetical protein